MYTARSPQAGPLRKQYSNDRIETASSAHILTLCFDRLDRDFVVARTTIENNDHFGTNQALGHAQDLLGELAGMLDAEVWENSGLLLSIYDYVLRLLAKANLLKSDALVAEAQGLITEIGEAFRTAARTGTPVQPELPSATDLGAADRPRLSVQA